MKNRKIHIRISEDGMPDFGFDAVTNLSDLGILDLFTTEKKLASLNPGEPCGHPGCLSHVTHPCESCGRVGGSPRFAQGGFLPRQDDKKRVLLDRGWWKCKKCGAIFEAFSSPPLNHVCQKDGGE